jgi:hypothetical protein
VLPGTVTSISGSGGLHMLYRHPGGYIKSGAGLLGPKVDVKADGGYFMVAPSVHPRTGRRYRWSGNGRWDYDELPPLHPALAARLRPPRAPVPRAADGVFTRPGTMRGRLADCDPRDPAEHQAKRHAVVGITESRGDGRRRTARRAHRRRRLAGSRAGLRAHGQRDRRRHYDRFRAPQWSGGRMTTADEILDRLGVGGAQAEHRERRRTSVVRSLAGRISGSPPWKIPISVEQTSAAPT